MDSCNRCFRMFGETDRFCSGCGQPRPAVEREDRLKRVTLLFADIKGFTAMSEQLDPDEVKEIIDELFGRLTRCIEAENGGVIKYEGDCIMAGWGLETARESDPSDCCRAMLAMMESLRESGKMLHRDRGFTIDMRIGAHCGRAVVGDIGGRLDVLGDAVNLAARLEQNALPGTILVSRDLALQTGTVFEFVDQPPLRVKGKQEAVACTVLIGPNRNHPPENGPIFCGRQMELQCLHQAWQTVQTAGHPAGCWLEAPGGLGKSFLADEFFRQITDSASPARIFRCDFPERRDRSGLLLAALLQQFADRSDGNITEFLERFLPESLTGNRHDDIRLLTVSAGLETDLRTITDATPITVTPILAGRVRLLIRTILEKLCAETPVIIRLEDSHRADPDSLQLVQHLVQSVQGPLLVLATARPGTRENTGPWQRLSLSPLPPEDARQLVAAFLSDEADIDQLLKRAAGHPLFLRTLTQHQRAFAAENSLPASVELAVQERLDGLEPPLAEWIRAASVMGSVFHPTLLAGMVDLPDFLSVLPEASSAGFILPGRKPDGSYQFVHELYADAARGQLTRRRSQELSRRIAGNAEQLLQIDPQDEWQRICVKHFADGGQPLRARPHALSLGQRAVSAGRLHEAAMMLGRWLEWTLDPAVNTVELPAQDELVPVWEQWSEALLLTGQHPQYFAMLSRLEPWTRWPLVFQARVHLLAIAHAEHCSQPERIRDHLRQVDRILPELDPDDPVTQGLEGDRQISLGELAHLEDRFEDSRRAYEEAAAIFSRLGHAHQEGLARVRLSHVFVHLGDTARSQALLDEVIALTESLDDDPMTRANLLNNQGVRNFQQGLVDEAIRLYNQTLDLVRPVDGRTLIRIILFNLARAEEAAGNVPDATRHFDEAERIAAEDGDPRTAAFSCTMHGHMILQAGDLDGAMKLYDRAEKYYRPLDTDHGLGIIHWSRGRVYRLRGELDAALTEQRASMERLSRLTPPGHAICLIEIAKVKLAAGDPDAARRNLEAAREHAGDANDRRQREEIEELLKDIGNQA